MVDSKDNYKFDLGVTGLNSPFIINSNKRALDSRLSERWPYPFNP